MKRKSILGLILLMSLSLLGIITAQFLWIIQSIKVQEEKFNSSVYRALDNTVKRIEQEQNVNYFFQQFYQPPLSHGHNNQSINNNRIAIINNLSNPHSQQIYNKKDTIIKQGNISLEVHTEISSQYSQGRVWLETSDAIIDLNELEKQLIHVEDSIKLLLKSIAHRNEEMREVYEHVKREIDYWNNPLQHRINLDHLNELLKEELKQNGINTKYEFAAFNQMTRQFSDFKSENFNIDHLKTSSQYQVNLFPNDIFRNIAPYELMIYFPDVATYLIKSQGLMVSLSVIFTLFILITFFVTIRTILNQKKVSQIKSDFINNMTHEFKTPIATISLATDSILTPTIINNPEHMKSFLKIIKEENSRMNSHVERVLQMSQIEKKDFDIVKNSKDIHELIISAVDNMQLLVNETGGKINTSLKAELSVFMLDEIHFSNVIINLLENALKYANGKPEVLVTTNNTNNGIQIIVKDKGIGMTREQQNKIFEKFYRATGGNVHNVKGFGLGLSYVKAVVDAHHGSIQVKSKLNVGTEFTIQLPYK